MSDILRIVVFGVPKPAGSKSAFIVRRRGGRSRVVVTDASGAAGKNWRNLVSSAAAAAMSGRSVFVGALELSVEFYLPRPKSHWLRDGVLRDTAPEHHIVRPDSTKLLRSVEDALTGIVWRDDAQVVKQMVTKRYAYSCEHPGCFITVQPAFDGSGVTG